MKQDIVELIKSFPLDTFSKGETMWQSGDINQYFYALQSGFAKTYAITNDGEQQMLWISGRYDLLPAEALFSKHRDLKYHYTALTNVAAYRVPKDKLRTVIEQQPEVGLEVARGMAEYYEDMLMRVQSVGQQTLRNSLLYTLHFIFRRFSSADEFDLIRAGLTLTHQDFANLIGASRESTSLELARLKNEGIISYTRGSFIIHNARLRPLVTA